MTDSRPAQALAAPSSGWILYDGECGFCFRWVHSWQNVVERRGFALKDLQTAATDGTLPTPSESLLDDRVLWRGYRWFNRNRYRISRHCEIPKK